MQQRAVEEKGGKTELSKSLNYQDELQKELEKIRKLPKNFENAWDVKKTRELSTHALQFSHGNLEDKGRLVSLRISLEKILRQFEEYKNVKQICDDFDDLHILWEESFKGKVDAGFYEGYHYVMDLMEAHFIVAYILALAKPLTIQNVQWDVPEAEINIDSIANKFVEQYQMELRETLFKEECDKFKKEKSPAINNLNERIKVFNKKCEEIINSKPKSLKKDESSSTKIMEEALSEEKCSQHQGMDLNELKNERAELTKIRDKLLAQNTQAIHELTLEMSTKRKKPKPRIDIKDWNEFKQKQERLKYTEDFIENLQRSCYHKPNQQAALEKLNSIKAYLDIKKEEYREKYNHWYIPNRKQDEATYEVLQKGYISVCLSYVVNPETKMVLEAEKAEGLYKELIPEREKRKNELDDLQTQLTEIVQGELSSDGRAKLIEEIIAKRRTDLMQFVLNTEKIQTISSELLKAPIEDSRKALQTINNDENTEEQGNLNKKSADHDSPPIAPSAGSSLGIKPEEKIISTKTSPAISVSVVKKDPPRNHFELSGFINGINAIFNKIKIFFSSCFQSMFSCFNTDTLEGDASKAEALPTHSANVKSSIATFPFTISTSLAPENSLDKQNQDTDKTKARRLPRSTPKSGESVIPRSTPKSGESVIPRSTPKSGESVIPRSTQKSGEPIIPRTILGMGR